MPTGYTGPIYEGKEDYTFEKFAMRCARSFGACVGLRDEPLDKEIDLDKHFQPSDYYKKELERAEKEYKEFLLNPPTVDELSKEYDEMVEKNKKEYLARKEENEQRKIRYYNMLSQAQDWVPPTPEHCKLKEFMIKQLEDSLNFDCGNYEPVTESREEYIEYRLSTNRFTREIEHYRESYQREVNACNERREWVKQLINSLK